MEHYISALHYLYVTLLEKCKLSFQEQEQLLNVVQEAETEMRCRRIPFLKSRWRSCWQILEEDWIKNSCEWIDSTDFWPMFPPIIQAKAIPFNNSFLFTRSLYFDYRNLVSLVCNDKVFISLDYYKSLSSITNIYSNLIRNCISDMCVKLNLFEKDQLQNPFYAHNFLCDCSLIQGLPSSSHNFINSSFAAAVKSFSVDNTIVPPAGLEFRNQISPISSENTSNDKIDNVRQMFVPSCKHLSKLCFLCNCHFYNNYYNAHSPYSCSCLHCCMKLHTSSYKTHLNLCNVDSQYSSLNSTMYSDLNVLGTDMMFSHYPYYYIPSTLCLHPSHHCRSDQLFIRLLHPLASLSSESSVARELSSTKLLNILECILQFHVAEVQELTCKIIANICCTEKTTSVSSNSNIHQTLQLLHFHPKFSVRLSALRALTNISSAQHNLSTSSLLPSSATFLANLKNRDGTLPLYRQGIYPVGCSIDCCTLLGSSFNEVNETLNHVKCINQKKLVDVILIHGVLGGASWTWRQHDDLKDVSPYSWCWPHDWLPDDIPDASLRIIALNYPEPGTLPQQRSLSSLAQSFIDGLVLAGVGQRPILWITHSRGGLLLKAIFSAASSNSQRDVSLLERTAGVVFLSTPHRGAPLAPLASLLYPSIHELKELGYGNRKLLNLQSEFEDLQHRYGFPVLSVIDMKPNKVRGIRMRAFPVSSADVKVGEIFNVDETHLDVCKPRGRCSALYRAVLSFIKNALHYTN